MASSIMQAICFKQAYILFMKNEIALKLTCIAST